MSKKHKMQFPVGVPRQHQQTIDVREAVPALCKGCGGDLFDPAVRLGIISSLALSNKTGQDVLVRFETYVCRGCGLEYGKDKAIEEDGQS